jgi:hypothetical protein
VLPILPVVVESPPRQEGCRVCGVIAHRHGRRTVRLVDAPCMGRPVELVWRKRTWRCGESTCPTGGWTELEGDLARPRALLTTRACWWAIGQLRREHASVAGLARQLGTTWRTVWRSIQPLLEALAEDETRSTDVTTLGVEGARVAPRVHQACGYRRPRPEGDARLGVTFHLEWNGCPTLSQGWVLTPLCNRYVKQIHDRGTAKKLLRRIIPIRERSVRKTSSQTGSTRLGWTWRTR